MKTNRRTGSKEKKTFEVRVRETVVRLYDVEAFTEEEARDLWDDGRKGLEVDRPDYEIQSVKQI